MRSIFAVHKKNCVLQKYWASTVIFIDNFFLSVLEKLPYETEGILESCFSEKYLVKFCTAKVNGWMIVYFSISPLSPSLERR